MLYLEINSNANPPLYTLASTIRSSPNLYTLLKDSFKVWLTSAIFSSPTASMPFPIIFGAVMIIWSLNYFNVLENIGRAIAPVFAPAGFGQWQPAVALIFGVLAKETVVGAFGTLFAGAEEVGGFGHILGSQLGWTPLVAFAFMVMILLYIPCVATLSIIKKETGSWKWTLFTLGYTLALGWIVATLIYQIGSLFM